MQGQWQAGNDMKGMVSASWELARKRGSNCGLGTNMGLGRGGRGAVTSSSSTRALMGWRRRAAEPQGQRKTRDTRGPEGTRRRGGEGRSGSEPTCLFLKRGRSTASRSAHSTTIRDPAA